MPRYPYSASGVGRRCVERLSERTFCRHGGYQGSEEQNEEDAEACHDETIELEAKPTVLNGVGLCSGVCAVTAVANVARGGQ
jgi:hypothetical protein